MKKSELAKQVASAVKEQGIELDKNVLAVALMTSGASLSMVNRELNKALKANGVVVVTNTGSEELKKVNAALKVQFDLNDAIAKAFKAGKDEKEIAKLGAMLTINTYKDLREWAETIEDEFAISFEAAVKAIKSQMKDRKIEVPAKVKLGVQKEEILNYFLINKKATSLKGLCEHLQKNVVGEDDAPLSKDKALHLARMNYTFASMLYNRTALGKVN